MYVLFKGEARVSAYLRGESQPEHEKHVVWTSEIFSCLFLKRDAVSESECTKVASEALHLGEVRARVCNTNSFCIPWKAAELWGSALLFGKG